MAEQEQQVSTEQPASTEAASTTETTSSPLEQVYEQFNVDAEAQSFQPQQAQVQQPQQTAPAMPAIPDPVLDPAGFKQWQAAQSGEVLRELNGLKQHALRQMVAEKNRAEAEEVKQLVSQANEVVGLPKEDADLIEFAYAKQIRDDKKFAAVYANRDKNPKAWAAASKAMNESLAKKFSVRADPQLAENQKALKQAQQTSATTKQTSSNPLEERLAGKNGAEFEREWNKMVRGGNF
jgi:hypothetical protein